MTILMAACFKWVKLKKEPREVKLVIIGLDDAGKTTTISCLQGEPPDGITPTVGFSNAQMRIGKCNLTIYDLGGGSGVRSVWQKYYADIHGVIFAVDSGDRDRLVESKNVLSEIFSNPSVDGKPLVVFGNKQDKIGALNEKEISEKLSLHELSNKYNFKFNVFSCSALQGYGKTMDKRIKTGIEWLLSAISQDYAVINEKVSRESAIQREQELKERKERVAKMRKIREAREKAAKEAGVSEDESDEDAAGSNPFRNIEDQIEVTTRREKKAKEKAKKIKAYEMTKTEDLPENSNGVINGKKKLKGSSPGVYDQIVDNSPDHFHANNADVIENKPNSEQPSQHQNGNLPSKKKNKKNKSQKSKRKSDDESNEDGATSPRKKGKSNEQESPGKMNNVAKSDTRSTELESHLADKLNVENNKIVSVSDLNYLNASLDLTQHNVIYVGSKENIREDSPPQIRNGKKQTKRDDEICLESFECSKESVDKNDHDDDDDARSKIRMEKSKKTSVNSWCETHHNSLQDSATNTQKTEKEINDSRAELFRAKSTESLDKLDQESNCCDKKPKKIKKRKKEKGTEDLVVELNTEDNNIEPQPSHTSKNDMSRAGTLPPLRGASKLEPINLKGRLPKWSDT